MKNLITLILMIASTMGLYAQSPDISSMKWTRVARFMPIEWYSTQEARDIAEVVLQYQMNSGGWPKNINFHKPIPDDIKAEFSPEGIGGTIDNEATLAEMRFLAKVYTFTADERYRDAFIRGLDYLLEAQYPIGGWPQFYPVREPAGEHYSSHITYNDNAYVNVMNMLRDITSGQAYTTAMKLDESRIERCHDAFERGINCILATQIEVKGQPTVWCAQHDEVTLKPAKARAYELPSYSGMESVDIVELLMSLPNPSQRVIAAVKGAMNWFDSHKIADKKYVHYRDSEGRSEARLDDVPGSYLWARFYDLATEQPFVCDRDGIKKSSIDQIGQERRGGYSWYTEAPQRLYPLYAEWLETNNL